MWNEPVASDFHPPVTAGTVLWPLLLSPQQMIAVVLVRPHALSLLGVSSSNTAQAQTAHRYTLTRKMGQVRVP